MKIEYNLNDPEELKVENDNKKIQIINHSKTVKKENKITEIVFPPDPMKILHKKSEIFQCKFCEKKFNLLGNLTKHMQYKHEGKKYHCNFCSKFYTQAHRLRNHIATVHEKSENPRFQSAVTHWSK